MLSGLRLVLEGDQLELTGSDLDLTISASIKVAGDEDGRAVIPAKLAADIVRLARARRGRAVETDGTRPRIVGGRSRVLACT